VWDTAVHDKMKFYTKGVFVDSQMTQLQEEIKSMGPFQWKRITEISMNPGVMREKLQPSKIFSGVPSSMSTVSALIAIVNHDIKFSTDYIGQSLYPHNV
jgi:hypothetical protein